MNWLLIENIDEWLKALQLSEERDVVLFKHSIRCHISTIAKRNFEDDFIADKTDAAYFLLDIINHRDISNQVAADLKVVHESPQLIAIRNKKAIYHTSHNDIDFDRMLKKTAVTQE